ncbi:MAG: hypothetical protein HYY06_01100 [Deltaproteobacteria bacterium]|nr:hypothetical protein [Deltaproteobacteria bacterium]
MNQIKSAVLVGFLFVLVAGCGRQGSGGSGNQESGGSSAIEDVGGRTSAHCRLDGDCDSGLDPICLRDSTLPDGYCTSDCVLNDDCDGESICVFFDDEDRTGLCMRMCRGDDDCESDQECFAITGASVCGV